MQLSLILFKWASPRPPRLVASSKLSRREVFLRSRLGECFSSSFSSCSCPRSCSSKLFSDTHFSSKNHKKSVSGGGQSLPGEEKCLSGGLGPKIPAKTPFGGDFKAKLAPKLGGQNFTFMLKNRLKRAPRGVRRGFQRVSKTGLNMEGS